AEKLSGTLDFTWKLNGQEQPAVKSAKAVFEKELPTKPDTGSITLNNQGKGALSVDLITHMQLLNDTLPAISRNLSLEVKYTEMNGTPLSIADIRQGTDFMAIVTVSNVSGTSDYSNLALTHILPSGWEIYNERMNATAPSTHTYTYQDVRDDRVLTYFDLRRGESKRFTVRLQAAYAGSFVLPAIQCEAMYDSSVQARTKAERTTVSR
ncbi:MAG: alpha-2-macroglobulin, partial [Bacteroides sp.]|nr:alpha-2-macroglobulin [Bacteroides sp.]